MSAPPSPSLPPWPTAAVLRHTLPSGAWHYDWLLAERQPMHADDRCARAFRVAVRPDQMQAGAKAALEEQPIHRAHYLALAAPTPISGDRGTAEPLAAGTVVGRAIDDDAREGSAAGGNEIGATGGATGGAAGGEAGSAAGGEASRLASHETVTVEWSAGGRATYRITRAGGKACVECVDSLPPRARSSESEHALP